MKSIHNLCIALLSVVTLASCATGFTPRQANLQLDYCNGQVRRALHNLSDGGTYDYTMQPRNILAGDTTWNCRKAKAEEWCSGFWPGILWMDYAHSKDSLVRRAAEGYTATLSFVASQPAFDHDLGFLTINSFRVSGFFRLVRLG